MSSLDSISSISTPGASLDFASPTGFTTALIQSPFELSKDQPEGWFSQVPAADNHIVVPCFQTFQVSNGDSTLLGYKYEDEAIRSGHFFQVWDPLSPNKIETSLLRMACHFLVDLTPASGVEEMLEKASDIREYYCSLANWRTPAIAEPRSVAINPVVVSYERDPFSYSEE